MCGMESVSNANKKKPVETGFFYLLYEELLASSALCVAAHELVHASGGIDQL